MKIVFLVKAPATSAIISLTMLPLQNQCPEAEHHAKSSRENPHAVVHLPRYQLGLRPGRQARAIAQAVAGEAERDGVCQHPITRQADR